MYKRILIVGTSCSGKSTLGHELHQITGIKHFDLDDLHWLPGWVEKDDALFLKEIDEEILRLQNWIVSGNYTSLTKDNLWKETDTVIWLNYSLALVLYRYFSRTIRRIINKEKVCGGNYESFRHSFLSNENLLFWILKTHFRQKMKFGDWSLGQFSDKHWVKFNNQKEADVWKELILGHTKNTR